MSTKLVRYKDVCAAMIPMIADMMQRGDIGPAIDTLKALGALEDVDPAKAVKEYCKTQPEPLTDKEQGIFLAAMGTEEKVCKQVDEECRGCREAYEDSLVKTCHEIIRKVKGALWT